MVRIFPAVRRRRDGAHRGNRLAVCEREFIRALARHSLRRGLGRHWGRGITTSHPEGCWSNRSANGSAAATRDVGFGAMAISRKKPQPVRSGFCRLISDRRRRKGGPGKGGLGKGIVRTRGR